MNDIINGLSLPWRALALGGVVGACLLLAGCATGGGAAATPRPATALAGRTDLREVLLRTDRDFANACERLGVAEAFAFYAAPDALMLPNGALPVRGRESIRRHLAAQGDPILTWSPQDAVVSAGGDLGYTWGFYRLRERGTAGGAETRHGKYVSIWQRQSDGSWKWVLDVGNPGPPPAP